MNDVASDYDCRNIEAVACQLTDYLTDNNLEELF
jgi:hypothetical protein